MYIFIFGNRYIIGWCIVIKWVYYDNLILLLKWIYDVKIFCFGDVEFKNWLLVWRLSYILCGCCVDFWVIKIVKVFISKGVCGIVL